MDSLYVATEGALTAQLSRRLATIAARLVDETRPIDRLTLLVELSEMGVHAEGMRLACTDFATWWLAVVPLTARFRSETQDGPPVVRGTGPNNWRDTEQALKSLGVEPILLLRAAGC